MEDVAMKVANLPIDPNASDQLPLPWERRDTAEIDRLVSSSEHADSGEVHGAVYREPVLWPRIFPSL
jgi:hypothetical protein